MPTDAKAAAGVVEQSVTALRRLADTNGFASDVGQVADELERIWDQRPLTGGLVGHDHIARRSFLNDLIGSELFDPERPRPAEQSIRVTVGSKTRCTARDREGNVDEFGPGDADPRVVASATAKSEQIESGRSEVETKKSQLELRKMALPPVLRERPPAWALWLWLWRWILGFFYADEQRAIRDAEAAVDTSREELDAARQDTRPAAPRDFAQRIRELTDAASLGASIERITLQVAGARLSEGVAVDDVPTASFEHVRDRVDAWFWVGNAADNPGAGAVFAGLRRLYVIDHSAPPFASESLQFRRAGDAQHAIESIGRTLSVERSLRIADRATRELRRAAARLDDSLKQHESRFAERIESLESRKIPDPDKFVSSQLQRIHPLVVEQVHTLLQGEAERARQLLDALSTQWRERINAAESSENIRDALANIEEDAAQKIEAASAEILHRIRVGLRQSVTKLHDRALVELRRISPPAENAIPLVPSPPDIGLSIATRAPASLGPAPGRLKGLFKSKKKLRAEICERIDERAGKLRDLTVSDLLDTEPVIGALLSEFVKASLSSAVREHDRWLAGAMVEERRSIERERKELAPLRQSRDVARADADRLESLVTQTEAALPPIIA